MNAKEIYQCDGFINGSKEILMVMEDDSLSFKSYLGNEEIEWSNVEFVTNGKITRLKFGEGGSTYPFKNDGILHQSWEKIM